jgi:GT2 family glycosyltransferase
MRASIVIASHNEGDLLAKTVASCLESKDGLDCEIVVADDASSDGSPAQVVGRFPDVRFVTSETRRGVSATKDMGARASLGDVIIFLDGHCKSEPGALERLVTAVEGWDGDAIVSPCIRDLDPDAWESDLRVEGKGFWLDLEYFQCGWANEGELEEISGRDGHVYLEQPSVVGCCLATSRKLYERAHGFDPGMRSYGSEDLDFGLKSWLLGYTLLVDPEATIGHRFRRQSTPCVYAMPSEHFLLNRLRMARKNLGDSAWRDWLSRHGEFYDASFLDRVWNLYDEGRENVETERDYMMRNRIRTEYDFAIKFGLIWPLTLPSSPFDRSRIPDRPRYGGLTYMSEGDPSASEFGHTSHPTPRPEPLEPTPQHTTWPTPRPERPGPTPQHTTWPTPRPERTGRAS